MDVDFLSSDIHFPSDSNEPKLSSAALHRPCCPDPVDWALHDYHHTVLEKEHVPLHALTDLRRLVPLQEKRSNETLVGTPPPSLKEHKAFQFKAEDVIFVVACNSHLTKSPSSTLGSEKNDLRAALRGALDRVNADLEAKDRLRPVQQDPSAWSWKEDVLQTQLLRGTCMLPQPSTHGPEERVENNSEEDETSTAVPSVVDACPSRTKTSILHKVKQLLAKPFHKPSSAPHDDDNNNKRAAAPHAHPSNGAGFRRILLKRRQT
ncbi:hypothetical protein BCR43DRAFT_517190 [Syncephalastrum racemosum]|uniref:Uncharacterized protein n=1 Tax=Syncephalastrum racemosum TaxID=13706 RepID=A0A1X2H6U3_SYNRA|nr:hypothetical protein BCR43DRAFT_517190 [Syncephalastrum racemosum]